MHRRNFLQAAGIAAVAPCRLAAETPSAGDPSELYAQFARHNDRRVERIVASQQLDRNSSFVGGFPNAHGICFTGSAAFNASYLTAAYLLDESRYRGSSEVAERLELALDFLLRVQHADGTIDLISTNFHSPPDTAFAVEPVALALSTVRNLNPQSLPAFQVSSETFLRRASEALIRGGIHTPNHRWVVCMALARLYQLFGDARTLGRIEQWLAEGIDVDADGQYAERSTASYTPLVNRCLITVARLTDRPELYEPVRKNLDLTRYLIRPNGELVTETSRRQDRARRVLPAKYYYPYRAMAIHDQDQRLAGAARFIEEVVGPARTSDVVLYGLEHREVLEPLPSTEPLPGDYARSIPGSRIVRIRRGRRDATIVAGDPTLFCLYEGAAVVESLRLASAFFGIGQFVAEKMEQQGDQFVLEQLLAGRYLQPLDKTQAASADSWYNMPHEEREQTGQQSLQTTIAIREIAYGFSLSLQSVGAERVPWALEVGLRPGGEIKGARALETVADAYLADQGSWSYGVGDDLLKFTAGPAEHQWVELRGAAPKLDARSVYYTGFTPIDFTLQITARG